MFYATKNMGIVFKNIVVNLVKFGHVVNNPQEDLLLRQRFVWPNSNQCNRLNHHCFLQFPILNPIVIVPFFVILQVPVIVRERRGFIATPFGESMYSTASMGTGEHSAPLKVTNHLLQQSLQPASLRFEAIVTFK